MLLFRIFTSRNVYEQKISTLELEIERLENVVAAQSRSDDDLSASTTLREASTIRAYPIVEDMTGLYDTVLISKGFC